MMLCSPHTHFLGNCCNWYCFQQRFSKPNLLKPHTELPLSLSLFDDSSSLSLPACLHCTGHYITDIRWFKQYPPPPPPLSSPPSLFTPLITVSTGALLSLGLLFCQRHTLQCSLCVPDNCTLFFLNILHVIAQAVRSNQSPGQKGKCRRRTCKLISLKVPETELCVLDISWHLWFLLWREGTIQLRWSYGEIWRN